MDVEETVDTIADVVKDTAKESDGALVPVIVGLLALGAGIGIGYFLGKRNKYEVITLDEAVVTRPPKVIIDMDDEEKDEPEEAATTVINQVVLPAKEVEVTVNNEPVRRTLFASGDLDDWDYDVEKRKRNPLEPFIIHRDEFFAEDPETEHYSQHQLTFYEADGVLTDELNNPLYDISSTVGDLVWGKGSGDPNICYIRNIQLQAEYEVIRDPGRSNEEALQLQAEENERAGKATRVRRMREPD